MPSATLRSFFLQVALLYISAVTSLLFCRHCNWEKGSNKSISRNNAKLAPVIPDSPLILFPGLGGSRLKATINRVSGQCADKDANDRLWPPIFSIMPKLLECWVQNIKLHFNQTANDVQNSPGVNISVPGFGETIKNEYLLNFHVSAAKYMRNLVSSAVSWGYERDKSIRCAPYDFRKTSPAYQNEYELRLAELIKETYEVNGRKKVTFLCHSLGCLAALIFLQRKQLFASTYVKTFISLGGPYGGSFEATRALLSGNNFGAFIVSNVILREAQRTWPSIHILQPREWGAGSGSGDEPLVITPTRNYSINNLQQLYADTMAPEFWELYKSSTDNYKPLQPPNLETYCVVGTGTKTATAWQYDKHFPNHQPKAVYSKEGDGTVLTSSAGLCREWSKAQEEPVHFLELPKVGHIAMISDCRVMNYVKSILVPQQPEDEPASTDDSDSCPIEEGIL